MIARIISAGLFLITLCSPPGCGRGDRTQPVLTLEEAEELLGRYIPALAQGDSTAVYNSWSSMSRDKPGFWMMSVYVNGIAPFGQVGDFVRGKDYQITGLQEGKDFYAITFKWIERGGTGQEGAPPEYDMVYYIIRENDRWVWIHPIDVLTRDWLSRETERIVFHYPASINIDEYQAEIEALAADCRNLISWFRIDLPEKIHYYRARSQAECGRLMTQSPSNGYAATWIQTVVTLSFLNTHEVIHVLDQMSGFNKIRYTMLTEGLAVAFGGNTIAAPEHALVHSRNLLGTPDYIPLENLLTMSKRDFLRQNYITYEEAGAFIRFLYDSYGLDKLQRFFQVTSSSEDIVPALQEITGQTITTLESEWHDYLLAPDLPEIGYAIPAEAEPVFAMEDPAGDDEGDGDYTYPRDGRFVEGVFDLGRFEVLKDSNRAYFRLQFREYLSSPVSYGTSTEKFMPGAVVALSTSEPGQRHRQRRLHGVQFAAGDGYDLKLNIGANISIANHFGKVIFSTPEGPYPFNEENPTLLEFSVPFELIGDPDREWRYFVGVGLVSDRTMNFLYGGPMPVVGEHPIFISGGNVAHGNPGFIDILVPEGRNQRKILSQYNGDRLAVVPMVGPD